MADRRRGALALVGTGWAGRVHALAAAACGAEIAVVADRTAGEAAGLAEAIDATPRSIDDLVAALTAEHGDLEDVAGVVVATPTAHHAELATRLLASGVPVLVETPLAPTLAAADALIAAAEATGTVACYAEQLLSSPAVDVAAARRTRLGLLDHLEVRLVQPEPSPTAGGVTLDLGVRAVALAIVLAQGDEPVAVRASLASARPDGRDDAGRIELRFASDLIAAIDVAWSDDAVPEWSAQAASAAGVVRLELQPHLAVEVDGEPVAVPAATGVAAELDARVTDLGFAAQLDAFRGVLTGRGGRICPLGFGRSVLEIVCAAATSAGRFGDEVLLPYSGPRDLTPHQLWQS